MSPALLLSILLSLSFGLIVHILRGGNFLRLLLLLLASSIGFAIGQLIGSLIGWPLFRVGEVYVLEGLIGSVIGLILINVPAVTRS